MCIRDSHKTLKLRLIKSVADWIGLFPVTVICFDEVYLLLSSLQKGGQVLHSSDRRIVQVKGGLVAKLVRQLCREAV